MNKNSHPLLTISLLSSGRSGTIERCLSSLASFKEQLDAEILVVDTDPADNIEVHQILEKYADRILPFDWIDDFSAARNVAVDTASGEWFLFLDDDEWFMEPQPVIDFLLSNDAEKYHWATYRIRNFFDDSLTVYRDMWGGRLFRMDKNVRFQSPIHEYFSPQIGDPYNIPALVGHTGYIYHTEDERLAHVNRNLSSVLQQMEKEPNEVRWVMEAILEYGDLKDADRQYELSVRGLSMMNGAKGYRNACVRGYFAASQLRILHDRGQFQDCYDRYSKFKTGRSQFGENGKAFMQLVTAESAFETGNIKEASSLVHQYNKAYEKHSSIPRCPEEVLDFLMDTFADWMYMHAQILCLRIDITNGDWTNVSNSMQQVEWENTAYPIEKYVRKLLKTAAAVGYNDHFSDMISILWSYDKARESIQELLIEMDDKGLSIPEQSHYWNLLHAIYDADISKGLPLDLIIIWEDHEGMCDNMSAYFSRLFAAMNPLFLDPKLWRIGLRRGGQLYDQIRAIPIVQWEKYVIEFISGNLPANIRGMSDLIDEVFLGLPDAHYLDFRKQADKVLEMAEAAKRQAEEAKKLAESQKATRTEMNQIIEALEKKVDDLVAAGMLEEAEMVLKEIQKYTDMMG